MDEKNEKVIRIALDGPGGAGKSTIAKKIAAALNLPYLDTGAMYRSFALYVMRQGISLTGENGFSEDEKARIGALLPGFRLEVRYEKDGQHMFVNGEDVTGLIRTPVISAGASRVSALPEVRVRLVELQREIAARSGVVMDGRDIGTHVLKDAEVKIFLTASAEARAMRRYRELCGKEGAPDYDTVLRELQERDLADSTRAVSPLRQAEDAILVDTTELSLEEAVRTVLAIVRERI